MPLYSVSSKLRVVNTDLYRPKSSGNSNRRYRFRPLDGDRYTCHRERNFLASASTSYRLSCYPRMPFVDAVLSSVLGNLG